jgi:hypothetical protein
MTVEGPALLHVFARAERASEDAALDLEIREGTRLRARSAMSVPSRARREAGAEDDRPSEVLARRATVHVPPGAHTYSLRASGVAAWVEAMLSEPSIHLQHAILGSRSEPRALDLAVRACDPQDAHFAPAICAFALALLGRDEIGATATSPLGFGAAMAAAPETARRVAVDLSQGGPREPVLELEERAAAGDAAALAALGEASLDVVDDRVRDAWYRGTVLGTEWRVAPHEVPRTWTSVIEERGATPPDVAARCALPHESWSELGELDSAYGTEPHRGARALELLARIPCDGGGPLALEVDGQPLAANPGASLTRWHVIVRGDAARARRRDGAGGHVYAIRAEAAACGARFVRIAAATSALAHPALRWPADVRAPGLELWLRDGTDAAAVDVVESTASPGRRVHLEARRAGGIFALDEAGVRWMRAARLALPPWAAAGARIEPGAAGDSVAVSASRAPTSQPRRPTSRTRTPRPTRGCRPRSTRRASRSSRARSWRPTMRTAARPSSRAP